MPNILATHTKWNVCCAGCVLPAQVSAYIFLDFVGPYTISSKIYVRGPASFGFERGFHNFEDFLYNFVQLTLNFVHAPLLLYTRIKFVGLEVCSPTIFEFRSENVPSFCTILFNQFQISYTLLSCCTRESN